ncbi:MAG: sugar transferase [Alicyclobacillus sp.]|nr:sugar transferase [Alicyclobacillus sp.]
MEYMTTRQRHLSLLIDVATVIISFYTTYWATELIRGTPLFPWYRSVFITTYLYISIAWILAIFIAVDYPIRRLVGYGREVWICIRANALGLLLFTGLAFVFKTNEISRMFLGSYLAVNTLSMLTTRAIVRAYLRILRRSGLDQRTRIIVGNGPSAQRYIDSVEAYPALGIRILGYVADHPTVVATPYLGTLDRLADVLQSHPVDGVVVTLPISDPATEGVIDLCEILGTPVELALDTLSSRIVHSRIVNGLGVPRMILSTVHQSPDEVLIKRLTDFTVSTLVLILLSPVFLLIAIAIKLDDHGPVFFSQTRCGLRGRHFNMLKFRSMCVDAEARRQQLLHLNEMSGPVFKLRNDPRVTRVGRFLRKTSLDELPQFINVWLGHMSLVGPRPPLPSEVNQYDPVHRRRLSVKPGITCLWQISGRNNIDFDQWMQLDLEYIDTWSYWKDIEILAKTIPAIVRGRGAS